MFRIRRVFDNTLPRDAQAIEQVQAITAVHFPEAPAGEFEAIAAKLHDPLTYRFRTILYVAERRHEVVGFALMLHVSDLDFCYLDWLGVLPKSAGRGIGAALYATLREEARLLKSVGIFMECLSDEAAICQDPSLLPQNAARLRFYERFGARPIVGTAYETPLRETDDCPPSLVYDDLGPPPGARKGRKGPAARLAAKRARTIVRAILERKYPEYCPPEYVERVVASFRQSPVALREPKYVRVDVGDAQGQAPSEQTVSEPAPAPVYALTVNDRHDIHHVRERGYVEAPVRISSILRALEPTGLFERVRVRDFPERHILAVHDRAMVHYFKAVTAGLPEGKSVYPYVFPIRNQARPPKELPVRAGYYCIDTFTPLNAKAYLAAKRAVDCALTAAEELLGGRRLAYALVRPPGHHAEHRAFGGFCYFNTSAVAAQLLSAQGRVAILDIDYHHGNGTQDIFYERGDVLTLSIHGHPRFAYPYFSGFGDEHGAGPGRGANLNLPLPEQLDGAGYLAALSKALHKIERFRPTFLIVGLGLDTAKGDPTGTWTLTARDFQANGRAIGGLGLPTLVVQEGGYRIRTLGTNARQFLDGLREGEHGRTRS